MAQCATSVARLYKSVIEEVMSSVREDFLDDGLDDQVLMELKAAWEQKLNATKVTQHENTTSSTQMHQMAHHHAAGGLPSHSNNHLPASAPVAPPQPVQQAAINLVPVQITVPAPQAGGNTKIITIHVPSSSLANGFAGQELQAILSAPSAAQTFSLDAARAADVIQQQLNHALARKGISLPAQLTNFTQLDGVNAESDKSLQRGSTRREQKRASQRRRAAKSTTNTTTDQVLSDTHTSQPFSEDSVTISDGEERLQSDGPDASGVSLHAPREALDAAVERALARMQVDGAHDGSSDEMSGDDDDDDEDINKEDDDDDDIGEDDEEGDSEPEGVTEEPLNSADDVSDDEFNTAFETDNVVVCQYDKITRVRNKWKFNLKDGIMSLHNKDFVFLKATGEGEW